MLVRYDWVIFLIIASLQCCVDNVKDILKEANNRGNPHTNLASSVCELYLYELQTKANNKANSSHKDSQPFLGKYLTLAS